VADELLTDAQALGALRRDPEAVCALYDRHVVELVRFLQRVGATQEVAWDVAQETFARLLARGYRGRVAADASAWPWLAVTSRNLLRDGQRRGRVDERARRRIGVSIVDGGEGELEDALARLDTERRGVGIGEALASLVPTQREAVLGRVVDEKEYEVLAEAASESEQTMRRRVSRGLRFMRTQIEEAGA
jgi:RNA polymerase sigma factor (sigma-70 family)